MKWMEEWLNSHIESVFVKVESRSKSLIEHDIVRIRFYPPSTALLNTVPIVQTLQSFVATVNLSR